MAEVKWTLQALEDLQAVCLYIARDKPPVASVFADRVFRAVDRLASSPLSGRKVPELGRDELREVIVGSYRVIHRVRPDTVEILAVHHGARRLPPGISE